MSDIQIAKIDVKCQCEKPDIEQPLQTACYSCNKDRRPDYRAPENLHELIRVANDLSLKISGVDIISFAEGEVRSHRGCLKFVFPFDTMEELSHALADAIIEAKK